MLSMTLEAENMQEMRSELLKAANSIMTDEVRAHEEERDISDMYEPMRLPPQVAATHGNHDDTEDESEEVSFPFPQLGATAQVQPTATGDLDTNGFPWDGRIHADTKTKTKSGAWKYRRGVDDSVKMQVEAELKGQRSFQAPAQAMAVTPVAPPVPTAPIVHAGPALAVVPPVAVAEVFTPPPVVAQVAPVVESVATAPVAQPSIAPAHSLATFKANLFPTIAELVKNGKITQEYIQQIKTHFGVGELWELNDAQIGELFQVLSTTNPPIIVAVP